MARSSCSNKTKLRRAERKIYNSSKGRQKKQDNGILADVRTINVGTKRKCMDCDQTEPESVKIPADAESESIVLNNEILANSSTNNEDVVRHNITNFSIYDRNGHMCSIDSGMLERNIPLYITGYVKPINDNSPSIEKGIAATQLGPIEQWWVFHYDDFTIIIGISTNDAEYLLIEPHADYKKYMTSVTEKTHLSGLVINSILDSKNDDPSYEDILNCVVNSVNPVTNNKFTEENLIAHAQYILKEVVEYDSKDTYYLPLAKTRCIKTLIELSSAQRNKTTSRRLERTERRNSSVKTDISNQELRKATTTELVKDVFENMFAAQLDVDDKENEATANKLVENVFDDVWNILNVIKPSNLIQNKFGLNDHKLQKNMFVVVENIPSTVPLIGRIEHLYTKYYDNMAHINLFMHSYETILGETADRQEIFALKKCKNIYTRNIIEILDVTHKIPSNNWFNLGGSKLQDLLEPVDRNDKNSFFYQLQYDDEIGRFEYNKELNNCKIFPNCSVCETDKMEKKSQLIEPFSLIEQIDNKSYYFCFKLRNEKYKVGNFIYLSPGVISKSSRSNYVGEDGAKHTDSNKIKSNEILKINYPEYYRKTLENNMCGSNESTPHLFEIAEIVAIYTVDQDENNVKLLVRRMYRPEQLNLNDGDKNADMNELYWSDEEFRIQNKKIHGKCYVAYIANILEPLEWSARGPDRFYFIKGYNFLTATLIPDYELPCVAKLTGKEVYVDYKYEHVDKDKIQYIPDYIKIEPLRALDIFAGCGGLSKGLEDSGLIKSDWAIECDDKAAAAFKLNNPESTVFVEDCNHLLKLAMSGCKTNDKNQIIPQKGEVEFICGGPPCQEFSGMNQFNSDQYSLFKNSPIVSFLSYIDYYRPKYFVMENVRNFVSFKRSMILKLTLRCITRMGYQCTFRVLQAGNFGVPQTRRMLIIMAAAPGENLPLYPEPIHVFNEKYSSLTIRVGDKKFKTNCKFNKSAPMRTVTLYDAWSDLPEISNEVVKVDKACQGKLTYKSNPITHFQKLLRYPNNNSLDSILTNHICKRISPLIQARIELIPVGESSDWRDLPNIIVKLYNGTMTNKLLYTHHDIKNGKNRDGSLRGVCQCASGEKCNPQDRQNNTIIPWCLPHTGNKHNNWPGLYGRLAWTGFCSTSITNPKPMGKLGKVLHPEQHRVVSVRECARSQGFNDSFLFRGSIKNKHQQIGNAVPPPMGAAIGHEIIKATIKKNKSDDDLSKLFF